MEGAKIYAQNAIRKKHEQLNFLKLASRLDATVSRLETQVGIGAASAACQGAGLRTAVRRPTADAARGMQRQHWPRAGGRT